MNTNTTAQQLEYDVVIMGAGYAGVCQARHLLLKIPNIRLAIIDPRSQDPSQVNHRPGESTLEAASMFLFSELGLHDYLLEEHTHKAGLNWHWPKDVDKTESLDDYYNIWVNRQLTIPSFHLNRLKFDLDVLEMNKQMGAHFYNGRVVDVDLTPGDEHNTVKVKLHNDYIHLKAKHLIDAAGRKFIIGRKTDNLLLHPKELPVHIKPSSGWVLVRNVDRTIFDNSVYSTESLESRYYATNHWMGKGHWLWMIPVDSQSKELSVGLLHHPDIIPCELVNTKEKFYAFIKANHNLVYKVLQSGEHVEFNYWPRIAHTSKKLFSRDNWYVIGDAASNFDALYSTGTTMSCIAIESVTEIIRAKLANEKDAEKKREAYHHFNLALARFMNLAVSSQEKQVGNASIMSWRLYGNYMVWFNTLLPIYVGKWHLDLLFSRLALIFFKINGSFWVDTYKQLSYLAERGTNIGFMDQLRADQLIGGYHPDKFFDNFLENAKLEPSKLNVFAGLRAYCFYIVIWFMMWQWKGFGPIGLLRPRNIFQIVRLLLTGVVMAIAELTHKLKLLGQPTNSIVAKTRQEFKSYRYQSRLQNWVGSSEL
ncbi:tryptophan halogenase [Fischerella thermalis CCMEE 5205]|uniref:NAD(P)/FAD-dependent oxidoreductase n=1 Tax=Fischerella thermalis TaxID=372787 RepID=UPI000C80F9AB|nr:tryptophan halogenase [Fischerella thermalis CCMEE 5205]